MRYLTRRLAQVGERRYTDVIHRMLFVTRA
jgi:hypothetical protein